MGLEGISEASEASTEATQTKREDPVAKYYRQETERDAARRARSERLGHELFDQTSAQTTATTSEESDESDETGATTEAKKTSAKKS